MITLLAVCLLGAATALPAAASGKEFEPTWPPSKKTPSGPPAFQGGGGFSLSLLYLDVDALNAKIQHAISQESWNLPTFTPGQPLVLWGGGGGAGGERVRFGGFGGGGELLEKSNNGASRFSLGFGGVTLHYVIRPGVESVALPHAGNPYPNGRVRFTVGGLVGGGGYELTLTSYSDPTGPTGRDYAHHRTASQAFLLLAPEAGVEFALTPFTHLRVAATYFYAIPVGGEKLDTYIHPDPETVQRLGVSVGLIFGIF